MAITKTGAIYKSLSFDNTLSRNYGVYITGKAVYNAPERAVEMISIPGRNGAFALDKGRFENIEVSYPAGIFAENETDFAQAVSDFRNFLCSKKGYCRLTDEYNPSEYRMAVYKSGLEVDPAQLRAGEFTITFECKPQRWLTSGETAAAVASGGKVTNPTLFESSPLLYAEGYGSIEFNGYTVEIANISLGTVNLWDQVPEEYKNYPYVTVSKNIPSGMLDTGDSFTVGALKYTMSQSMSSAQTLSNPSITSSHSGLTGVTINTRSVISGDAHTINFYTDVVFPSINFVYGTYKQVVDTATMTYSCYIGGGSTTPLTVDRIVKITYDGDSTVTFYFTHTNNVSYAPIYYTIPGASGESSVIIGGYNLYIDCDIGEAYYIDNGEIISLNAYIDLGSDLPKLAPGQNTITYDNTITTFTLTPRWWKV